MTFDHFRISRLAPGIPRIAHITELIVGLVIIAGVQGLTSVFVSADADIAPPSVPTNVQVAGRTASSVDLAWDASTDDVSVAGYKIYRGGTEVASSVTNSYTDSGLTPNTGYTYTVSAYDPDNNTSSPSGPVSTTTLADTSAPSVPDNVRQTGSTVSTISIAWDESSDNVGVTNYEIYRNGSQIKLQSSRAFTDTGLQPYTTYTYNIVARDGANNTSALSAPLYGGTAQDVTAPSVPDNLRKQSSTVSSITLAWNASTDDVSVTGYRVYRNGTLVGTSNSPSYTDSGLNVSTGYTYTVQAYDAGNNASADSQPFNTASSDDTTAPSAPTNVRATNTYDTSIELAWDASTDDVGVIGYKVYRNGTLVATTANRTFTDTELTPVTTYTYTVHAYDAANNTSAASASFMQQTEYDTTAPSVPANLRTTAQTDTSVTLAWDASTDNVAVSGYDVYRGNIKITTTASTTYTDSGLEVDTPYTYTVRAHDAYANNSAQSAPLNTRTLPDLIAPETPANVRSDGQSTTTLDIAWDAATDDVAVTGYKVYRNGSMIATVTGTTYQDTVLRYNQEYLYKISAVDNAGNESPQSAEFRATTDPDVTAPTVALTAPSNGAKDVKFTIGVSATASDDLDLARVEFYADSTKIASITQAPFAFNWDTYAVKNGTRQITAKAIDGAGNSTSESVSISINNPPPALRGDLNNDHKVTIFDLSILLSRFNKSATTGDFNNNGRIDIFDLSVLLAQYGKDNNYY